MSIDESSENSSLISLTNNNNIANSFEKKVRFSMSPVVYPSVPWVKNGIQSPLDISDSENLLPIKSSFKEESKFDIRTPMREEERIGIVGILLICVFLCCLFVAAWWVLSKLLLLEIENQVSGKFIGNSLIHNFFVQPSSKSIIYNSNYIYIDY